MVERKGELEVVTIRSQPIMAVVAAVMAHTIGQFNNVTQTNVRQVRINDKLVKYIHYEY